jgi:uncharacterized membrane protein HdeD (DUF308 family)
MTEQASFAYEITSKKTWFYVVGSALVVLGVAAIAFPFLTTIAAKLFLGWLILIGGMLHVIHAFGLRQWSEFLLELIIGSLFIIVGGWLALFPLTGILTLTLLLALTFIIQGIMEAVMAIRLRPHPSWFWLLLAGLVAMAVGLMLIAELPSSATWAIGLLVGVNLIMSGLSHVFLPMAVRQMQ